MARKIKRFFVFLLFSLFFSLMSGKVSTNQSQKGSKVSPGEKGWNAASAGQCCENSICYKDDGKPYCC